MSAHIVVAPIETKYKGYRFRSRLEARWAVFFDTIGLRWEYEKEGYTLPSGRYLPDFWLPDFGAWVEIKGTEPSQREKDLCSELSEMTGEPGSVMLVHGLPDENRGLLFCAFCDDSGGGISSFEATFGQHPKTGSFGVCVHNTGRRRDFYHRTRWDGDSLPWVFQSDSYIIPCEAVEAARSARFEYGEHGI